MAYDNGNGYLRECRNGVKKMLHRWIWEEAHGPIPSGMEIDHIDGDRKNNNLSNLRLVDRHTNMRNKGTYSNNLSGVTGVVLRKCTGKWRARIRLNKKDFCLGQYDDWFDAVCARMSANNRYGFHENHGRR
jgi:hypothetical protein